MAAWKFKQIKITRQKRANGAFENQCNVLLSVFNFRKCAVKIFFFPNRLLRNSVSISFIEYF